MKFTRNSIITVIPFRSLLTLERVSGCSLIQLCGPWGQQGYLQLFTTSFLEPGTHPGIQQVQRINVCKTEGLSGTGREAGMGMMCTLGLWLQGRHTNSKAWCNTPDSGRFTPPGSFKLSTCMNPVPAYLCGRGSCHSQFTANETEVHWVHWSRRGLQLEPSSVPMKLLCFSVPHVCRVKNDLCSPLSFSAVLGTNGAQLSLFPEHASQWYSPPLALEYHAWHTAGVRNIYWTDVRWPPEWALTPRGRAGCCWRYSACRWPQADTSAKRCSTAAPWDGCTPGGLISPPAGPAWPSIMQSIKRLVNFHTKAYHGISTD